jgi:hypothetical protein
MALEGDTLTYTYDGERNVLLDSVRGGDSRLRRLAPAPCNARHQ